MPKAATPKPTTRAAAKPSARAAGKTVEGYVAGLAGWQADAVSAVRALVKEAAPTAVESIKWGQPVYEAAGPFAYVRAFKTSVNFGFWRGADLPDPKGLLVGEGDRMKHIKLTAVEDIKPAPFKALVKAAVALNKKLGDPAKR